MSTEEISYKKNEYQNAPPKIIYIQTLFTLSILFSDNEYNYLDSFAPFGISDQVNNFSLRFGR